MQIKLISFYTLAAAAFSSVSATDASSSDSNISAPPKGTLYISGNTISAKLNGVTIWNMPGIMNPIYPDAPVQIDSVAFKFKNVMDYSTGFTGQSSNGKVVFTWESGANITGKSASVVDFSSKGESYVDWSS